MGTLEGLQVEPRGELRLSEPSCFAQGFQVLR